MQHVAALSAHDGDAMQTARPLARIAIACMLVAAPCAGNAASDAQVVERPSRYLDKVLVVPQVDFRGYSKVLLEPSSVSFANDWLKDMNANRIALLRGTTTSDAYEIAREAAKGLDASLSRAFPQGGFELASVPGPGTVTVVPRITNLYVNAPRSVNTQPGRTYITNAGYGTYAIDVRDSTTGQLVAQMSDDRRIGDRGVTGSSLHLTTPATNAFDFRIAFDEWAAGTVTALEELRRGP
jgi:hypothetical protein